MVIIAIIMTAIAIQVDIPTKNKSEDNKRVLFIKVIVASPPIMVN